ncbi:MAG: septal ring lytic transglycosylase RlpA family protein [Gammaproteobacteria bacterium]|nr:septal ring lytic transglycosylase RlpA family protein [Gammaproteobacteria bacterium]
MIGNRPETVPVVCALLCAVLPLAQGCSILSTQDSGPRTGKVDTSSVGDAVPRDEPRSRYGNPESYIVHGRRYHVLKNSDNFAEEGIASWYGEKFHGRRTSNGETYDMYAMTAAHKTLPLPTYVEVTNLKNGKKVIVRVNDRGPFHDNRIIDLTYTAATKLDILNAGTGLVRVRAVNSRNYREPDPHAVPDTRADRPSGFYIQVGAFSSRINAENLRGRLGVLGDHLINIHEAVVAGKTWYRVRLGPIQEVDAADRIVNRLVGFGIFDHQIVVE